MEDKIYDCVIVGGGISGVSFAHYLAVQGKRVLILEKEGRVGGQVKSPLSEVDKNYWRELGAHTCYNSYTHLLGIVKELKQEQQIQELGKGSYLMYTRGKIKSAMSQIGYPSLFFNGPKIFFSKRTGKTVKEYFQNIVGKKNYEKLFTFLFRAVLSQNADNYPADIFLKRRDGRYEEFPRKYTFSKGLSSFIDMIVEKNKLEIVTDCDVIDVLFDKKEQIFKLIACNGAVYNASKVAFAVDPRTTARLINNMEPELAGLLSSIPLSCSESMNVILKKGRVKEKALAGIIPMSNEFNSAVSRDLLEDEKYRSFTFHFPVKEKTKEQKIKMICEVLSIKEDDILEISEDDHILPSLRIEHLSMAEQVAKKQKDKNIYILGNYFYGLSLEDCVNRSYDESLRFIGTSLE